MKGLQLIPHWTRHDGKRTRTILVASWHNPKSLTWRWGVYLHLREWFVRPRIYRSPTGYNFYRFGPLVLRTQPNVFRGFECAWCKDGGCEPEEYVRRDDQLGAVLEAGVKICQECADAAREEAHAEAWNQVAKE